MHNAQFPSWQYGYTLGPATEANRGNYSVYQQYGQQQQQQQSQHQHHQQQQQQQYGQQQRQQPAPPGTLPTFTSSAASAANTPPIAGWPSQSAAATPAGFKVPLPPQPRRENSNLKYITPTPTPVPTPPTASSTYNQALYASGNRSSTSPSSSSSSTTQPIISSGPKTWKDIKPNLPSTFKAKVFVTASSATPSVSSGPTTSTAGVDDDPPYLKQACAQLHELAVFNNIVERYDQKEDAAGKNFTVNLKFGNESYQGTGASVKAAKQNAAMHALANTAYQSKKTMKPRSSNMTATSELYEAAAKKCVDINFTFIEPFNFNYHNSMKMWSKAEMRGKYKVKLTVAGKDFYGEGELPQQAKHDAAGHAVPFVRDLPTPGSGMGAAKTQAAASSSSGSDAGSSEGGGDAKNAIMMLNEIGMSRNLIIDWNLVGETGPVHQKFYSWSVTLGEYQAIGSASNKKVNQTIS